MLYYFNVAVDIKEIMENSGTIHCFFNNIKVLKSENLIQA